jgi:toxin CcdB
MAQFDVYRVPGAAIPYVVDIQSDYLDIARTRVVIPLARIAEYRGRILASLNPVFDISGEKLLLLTTQTATLPRRILTDPVASLARHRDAIVRAVDTLLLGA